MFECEGRRGEPQELKNCNRLHYPSVIELYADIEDIDSPVKLLLLSLCK